MAASHGFEPRQSDPESLHAAGKATIFCSSHKLSREDFERFEKRARKLGLTPSLLLESIITGKPPEEVKGNFTRPSWLKLPQGNFKRRRPIE